MTALEAFQQALRAGADDDALDAAAAAVRKEQGPSALAECIRMRITAEQGKGKTDLDVAGLRFRLAAALEEVGKASVTREAATAALEAAQLAREVLNDGEAATRNLVHALKASANDDALLKRAVEAAGGGEQATHIAERALKKPDVKEDAQATALLRRALSRIAELSGDKERAFFEALKCARKAPGEGLYVDEVFRLALETGRHTEASAFFSALADDESLPQRQRATIYNKLGQTLEKQGEKRAALEAYTKSLRFHEAKAAKRSAERLAAELGVDLDLPSSTPPTPATFPQEERTPPEKPTAKSQSQPPAHHPIMATSDNPEITPPYDYRIGTVTKPEADALAAQQPAPAKAASSTSGTGTAPSPSPSPNDKNVVVPSEDRKPALRAAPPKEATQTAQTPRPDMSASQQSQSQSQSAASQSGPASEARDLGSALSADVIPLGSAVGAAADDDRSGTNNKVVVAGAQPSSPAEVTKSVAAPRPISAPPTPTTASAAQDTAASPAAPSSSSSGAEPSMRPRPVTVPVVIVDPQAMREASQSSSRPAPILEDPLPDPISLPLPGWPEIKATKAETPALVAKTAKDTKSDEEKATLRSGPGRAAPTDDLHDPAGQHPIAVHRDEGEGRTVESPPLPALKSFDSGDSSVSASATIRDTPSTKAGATGAPGARSELAAALPPPPSLEKSDPALPPVRMGTERPVLDVNSDEGKAIMGPAGSDVLFPPATTPFPIEDVRLPTPAQALDVDDALPASIASSVAAMTSQLAQGKASENVKDAKLEAALARLPERPGAQNEDGVTRRVPHAAGMKTSPGSAEGNFATSEGVPSKKGDKKSAKGKKEKTQKRKKPLAPGAPKILVDNSKVDGAPIDADAAEAAEAGIAPDLIARAAREDARAAAAAGAAAPATTSTTPAKLTSKDEVLPGLVAHGTGGADIRPALKPSETVAPATAPAPTTASASPGNDGGFVVTRASDGAPRPIERRELQPLHGERVAGGAAEDSKTVVTPRHDDSDLPTGSMHRTPRPASKGERSDASPPAPALATSAPAPALSSSAQAAPIVAPPKMESSQSLARSRMPPPGIGDGIEGLDRARFPAAAGDDGAHAGEDDAPADPTLETPASALGVQPPPPPIDSDEPAESTMRGAPAPGEPPAAATAEGALPPLAVGAMSIPSMEGASPALTRANAALEANDAQECAAAASALSAEAPTDLRVLKLAARAMLLRAEGSAGDDGVPKLPADAIALFIVNAEKHGDRAVALALDIQRAMPPPARKAYRAVWLAGARAAGMDTGRVLELLRESALEDAPDGKAFEHCMKVLERVNDVEAIDALLQAALKHAFEPASSRPEEAKVALLQRRIALLESGSRFAEALPLHAQLAVDVAVSDAQTRNLARQAFAARGTPDERARFLSRLGRKLTGDDGADVVRELLDVRLSVDDRIGAEAAAKDLLERHPGDAYATKVLADLLEQEAHRADELIDLLRVGAQQSMSWFGKTAEARVLLERLAGVLAKAGRHEDAADALVQVARLVPDDANLNKALAALDETKRHKEAVALLEETATSVSDADFRVRVLLRAAEIAKGRLQKRGKARELTEKALDASPKNRAALRAWADLLVEIGDVPAAVAALERLTTEEKDLKERATTHLRIGRLLEEHVLKPEEALKRYRVAAELNPALKDAWSAMRAIARQRGDRGLLVESLRGLAGAEGDSKERASLLRQVAKVERDERADAAAAEKAFAESLSHEPADAESLMGLATLLAARLQPDVDLDAALAQPGELLLEALTPPLQAAFAQPASAALSLQLKRLDAMALSRSGDRGAAGARFEALLAEAPEDMATLMAFARHLAAAPRTETAAETRRLRCLETLLLHHAYSLKPPAQVDVWGDVTALRAATGDGAGARKAAKKVMALATTEDLKACLSDRAVRAVALALDDARDTERDPKTIIAALELDAQRSIVDAEQCRLLERAGAVATDELKDREVARALLEKALQALPHSSSARDALLDLDIQAGDVAGALKQVRDLLHKETDPSKKAALHLRMFRLRKKLDVDVDGAAVELKAGLELDPANGELLDAAEQFFTEKKDADGLDKLWSAQLRSIERGDRSARLKLLERLAQLRRYEKRDFAGAVEALEAMTALDPEALKPREDAARLYTELGQVKEAVAAWRGVLERDPLAVEAWRGIFGRFAHARAGDEAFAAASTMVALDVADEDIGRIVRTIRPPFPRWPLPPKDLATFRRKVSHPLERTPVRAVLDAAGARLLPLYARDLKSFGLRRRDALAERNVPTSVLLAVRTLAQLLGLKEPPPLFAADLGVTASIPGGGAVQLAGGPPFAVLPATEPGIIVTSDVLKGGMTPERAFALGRAAAWLQPHAVMAAAVDAAGLRAILEGLVAAFLGAKSLEKGADLEAETLGKELQQALLGGLSTAQETALKEQLLPALRDYVHARQQVQVSDWRAGVGYSGDRVGFLMSTDLNAAFRVIKQSAGGGQSIGARLAIKELVLFSVSSSYLALRKDLGLALPELAASPLLELG